MTAPRWTEEGMLFTEQNMNEFKRKIGGYMSRTYTNVELYTLNEFRHDYYEPQVRQSGRLTGAKIDLAREASFQNRQTISNEILSNLFVTLANNICVDSKKNPVIGERYGESAIKAVIRDGIRFDILIAVNNPSQRRPAANTRVASISKIDNVVAFIIAEYGECEMKPDIWSVNLICAGKASNVGLKGLGNVLLGAFLYCIKESNYKKEAVLELATGYTNMAGFISYSKLGFNKDLSLYQLGSSGFFKTTQKCFTDLGNLPMSINLSRITSDVIINRVTGTDRRVVTSLEDDTGLFNAKTSLSPREQQKVIDYSNILYRIEAYYGYHYADNPFDVTNDKIPEQLSLDRYELDIYNKLRGKLLLQMSSPIGTYIRGNNVNDIIQMLKQERNNVYQPPSVSPVPSPLPASPGSPFGSPPGTPPPGSPTSSAATKSGWVCNAERCVYVVGTGAGALAGFMVGGPKLATVGAVAGATGAHKVVKGAKSLFGYNGGKSKKKSKRANKTRRKTKHR